MCSIPCKLMPEPRHDLPGSDEVCYPALPSGASSKICVNEMEELLNHYRDSAHEQVSRTGSLAGSRTRGSGCSRRLLLCGCSLRPSDEFDRDKLRRIADAASRLHHSRIATGAVLESRRHITVNNTARVTIAVTTGRATEISSDCTQALSFTTRRERSPTRC